MSSKQAPKRILFFSIFLALLGGILVVRYASIMLKPSAKREGTVEPALERGPILDRNGRILALQTQVYTLSAWPENIADLYLSSHLLAPLLKLDEDTLYERLSSSKEALVLARNLDLQTGDELKALINSNNLGGFFLEPGTRRMYTEGSSAAQVLGFTGRDNRGLEGLEYRYDPYLASTDSILPDGKAYGYQLILSLDSVVQQKMEALAEASYESTSAEAIMLYVMDSRTGEILAYVNRPSYNPNSYQDTPAEKRRNLGTGYVYEPGSVFKVFTLASFLDRKRISTKTQFQTSGGYRNKLFKDPITDLADYGTIDLEGIIKYSSNVGAALASDSVSNDEFHADLEKLGFGRPTGSEMPGEERGQFKNTDQWSPRTKPTIAFGQEISVTALQMLQASTALANNGLMLRPQIVRKIVSSEGTVIKDFTPEAKGQVLSAETARIIRNYMNSASEDTGTGYRGRVKGLNISIKTGTAQMVDPKSGSYSHGDFIASSLGIVPTEEPRLIIYVVIIKPRGEIYGGRIAAPLIREASEFLITYLGLERQGDTYIPDSPKIQVSIPSLPTLGPLVPDYRGLPLRTVMGLHNTPDLKVELKGSGYVVKQEPAPGTPLSKGMTITLYLDDSNAQLP